MNMVVDAETQPNLYDLLRRQRARIKELEIELSALEKDIDEYRLPSGHLAVTAKC